MTVSYCLCMLTATRKSIGLAGLLLTILVLHAFVMVIFVHEQYQLTGHLQKSLIQQSEVDRPYVLQLRQLKKDLDGEQGDGLSPATFESNKSLTNQQISGNNVIHINKVLLEESTNEKQSTQEQAKSPSIGEKYNKPFQQNIDINHINNLNVNVGMGQNRPIDSKPLFKLDLTNKSVVIKENLIEKELNILKSIPSNISKMDKDFSVNVKKLFNNVSSDHFIKGEQPSKLLPLAINIQEVNSIRKDMPAIEEVNVVPIKTDEEWQPEEDWKIEEFIAQKPKPAAAKKNYQKAHR